MLEKYYVQRIKDKDYVIFIKVGNFYELFEKDALIINKLLNYKIKRFSKTFKSGFPTSKINDVIKIFEAERLNYVVIDNNEIARKSFKDNAYCKFNFDIDRIMLNYLKIDKITSYLNDNVLNGNIIGILEEMEKLL